MPSKDFPDEGDFGEQPPPPTRRPSTSPTPETIRPPVPPRARGRLALRTGGWLRHDLQSCDPPSSRWANSLSWTTTSSRPPTINSVGARTRASHSPARSGRPPRDTTAAIRSGRCAAATSAAPAPVLAPKYASRRCAVAAPARASRSLRATSLPATRCRTAARRSARLPLSSVGVNRVQEKRPVPLTEYPGYVAIARRVPRASAAMREDHDRPRPGGHGQRARQFRLPRGDPHLPCGGCHQILRHRAWLGFRLLPRASRSRTCSSDVARKSRYQRPTATNGSALPGR